jgi:transposase
MLPQEMNCGSGMSCWRRLRDWQEAGIWQLIHFSLLDWLARYGQIDWSRAVVDGSSVRAVFGARRTVAMTLRPSGKVYVTDASSPFLRKRNTEHGSGLGRWRWVVERTFAWLNQFRRLRIRYEKRADIDEAFLALACALLCWNALEKAWHMGNGSEHS